MHILEALATSECCCLCSKRTTIAQVLKRSSDWLPTCLSVGSLFYKVEALVRCFMVVPASSAEAEGRFSASGRLKVWFRSNLKQSGFNQSVMFIRTVMKWTEKMAEEEILKKSERKVGKIKVTVKEKSVLRKN